MKKTFTLLSITLLGILLIPIGVFAQPQTITNDIFWKDTDKNFIYSQGGGVILVGDTYYWYGVKYNGAVTYAANPTAKNGDIGFAGVTCYSSKDLVNWKNEGLALAPNQVGGGWFGRIGVVYNSKTKMYVLAGQGTSPSGAYGEYFATSSTPDGPFTFKSVQTDLSFFVNGGTGDQTTFQDDDGKAYIICSNVSGRSNLYVAPLRESDFLAIEPTPTRIYRGTGREGNAMFKHNGTYYFCSSDLHGWNTSRTYCMSAKNILGPYSSEFVLEGTQADFSHVTQTGFFISVKGSKQSFVIYAGDRWSDFAGNGFGYNQWLPITFESGTPRFHSLSQWNLDETTGEWSVGADNNYALNPTFEADRVLQTQLTGWTVQPVDGTNINSTSNKRTGRFGLYLTGTKTFSQNVATVPNGTYTLSAWVRSSGGQSSSQLYANGFGGSEKSTPLNTSIANWTKKSVPDIQVTNGSITLGVKTNGSSSQWINIDDFELIRSGKTYSITNTSSPGGLIVQSPEGSSLSEGTRISFTASALSGWQFTGWTGSHSGTDTLYTVSSLSGNIALGANFKFVSTDSVNYEGENTKRNKVVVDTEHLGYSGSGYANFENIEGSSMEFNVVVSNAGMKYVTLYYANGSTSERPVSVFVNGVKTHESVVFTSTSSWDTWNTLALDLQLSSGINTITLVSNSMDGGPNIDLMKVNDEQSVQKNIISYSKRFKVNYNQQTSTVFINNSDAKLQLYSINGIKVFDYKGIGSDRNTEVKLPINQLDKGVYLLKIFEPMSNQSQVFKIVKH